MPVNKNLFSPARHEEDDEGGPENRDEKRDEIMIENPFFYCFVQSIQD